MAKFTVPQAAPTAISKLAAGKNAIAPAPMAYKRLADSINQHSVWQKKTIFSKSQDITNIASGSGSTVNAWWGRWSSSVNVSHIRAIFGLVDTDYASAVDPYLSISIVRFDTGDLVNVGTFHYNGKSPSSNWWTLMSNACHQTIDIAVDRYVYNWVAQLYGGARLAYLTLTEVASPHADDAASETCVDAGKYLVGSPIYWQQHRELADACRFKWCFDAAHLLTWTPDYGAVVAVSATTLTNVVDGSSTSVTANTPGVYLQTTYHNRSSESTVTCDLAVRAIRTAGAGSLSLRLTDGTDYVEITDITTAGVNDWYSVSVELPADYAKYDIQAKVSAGGTTFDLYSVVLYESRGIDA